jgi:acetyl esterase/lipase
MRPILFLSAILAAAPAWSADPAATTRREVVYKTADGKELKLHLHFPADWKAGDKRPAIVFFFGGGWVKGSPTQFEPQAEHLASRGMVAARADYRLGLGPVPPATDARSAVRYLRSHAAELGIDPERIAAAGGSAGGHLAATTALGEAPDAPGDDLKVSARPDALVLFNPALQLDGNARFDKLSEEERKKVLTVSPIRYLTKDAPPTILFFGTSDAMIKQGRDFAAKAAGLGVRAELYTADGQPHGFFNRSPWRESTLRAADAFLVSLGWLKGEPAIAAPANAELKHEKP